MKLLAIDGNSLINRAFYGIKMLTTKNGQYTNALYGFINILHRLEEMEKPDGVVVAFDLKDLLQDRFPAHGIDVLSAGKGQVQHLGCPVNELAGRNICGTTNPSAPNIEIIRLNQKQFCCTAG